MCESSVTRQQYPTESLFQKDERVWLITPECRDAKGPYLIVAVIGDERYRLREELSDTELECDGKHFRRRL
jgi:hypothetical protein